MATVDGARRGQAIYPSRDWRVHGEGGSISFPLFTVRARANESRLSFDVGWLHLKSNARDRTNERRCAKQL